MTAQAYDADSVAALLVLPEDRYVLQLRDRREGVDFPGAWGLFGGALEPGERADEALQRELLEELAFACGPLRPFSTLVSDERFHGGWYCRRQFFELAIAEETFRSFVLSEGAALSAFSIAEVCARSESVIPFDLLAILMHGRRVVSEQTRPLRPGLGANGEA